MRHRETIFRGAALCALLLLVGCSTAVVTIPGVERAEVPIIGVEHLAVLDFVDTEEHAGSGRAASSALIARLDREDHYELVERRAIEQVMNEQRLGLSDIVWDETAAEVGRLLGADAIIVGEVSGYDVETTEYKKEETVKVRTDEWHYEMRKRWPWSKEKEKVKVYEYEEKKVEVTYREKAGTVRVNYRMVDVSTGRVIVARTKTASYSRKAAESPEELGEIERWMSILGIGLAADLPDDGKIISDLLDDVTGQFVAAISPHRVERRKVLDKEGGRCTKRGVQLAQAAMWDEAIVEWRKAVLNDPRDAAAHNNLGIAYERAARFEDAWQAYREAIRLDPDHLAYRQNMAHLGSGVSSSTSPTGDTYIVLEVEEDSAVYIDYGEEDGARLGDRLQVYREKTVRHPATGQIMGTDTIEIADVEVTEVFPKMSATRVVRRLVEEAIRASYRVKCGKRAGGKGEE